MKKIPTLFKRDPNNMSRVLNELHPDCAWVAEGEGVATRKYDGTCCLVRDGRLYGRREVRKGKQAPDGFEAVGHDPVTGKTVGWVPVGDGPEWQYHREAVGAAVDGTYELIGPKIQGNPEGYSEHVLIRHADIPAVDAPRTFEGLREWLADWPHEGLVFHHSDGRMAKIKRRDFIKEH